jgi:hypothetical protein
VTGQVAVFCSLDFKILYTYIYIHIIYTYYMYTMCIVDHMSTQFRLAPDLPERNYCVSRQVSITTRIVLYSLRKMFFLISLLCHKLSNTLHTKAHLFSE